jgi:hypothetical protein
MILSPITTVGEEGGGKRQDGVTKKETLPTSRLNVHSIPKFRVNSLPASLKITQPKEELV